MLNKTVTGVTAIVVETVDIEIIEDDGSVAPSKFLLGCGFVTHRFIATGEVVFRIRHGAATLFDDEMTLLDGIEDQITATPMLVGHDLASTIATLQAIANPARHLSIGALSRFDATVSELSLKSPRHVSPLSVACAEGGIRCIPEDLYRDQSDFVIGRAERVKERMALRAAAVWKLWANREAVRGSLDRRLVDAAPILDATICDAFSFVLPRI
jgi:hypothetical protein